MLYIKYKLNLLQMRRNYPEKNDYLRQPKKKYKSLLRQVKYLYVRVMD